MKKTCQICGRDNTKVDMLSAVIVRPAVAQLIKSSFPNWDTEGFICRDDLRKFRNDYLTKIMQDEKGELSNLEKDVIDKLTDYETISSNIEKEFVSDFTFGERVSDKIAAFGGSWKFISIFVFILFIWIGINSYILLSKPFDPYPFILLNLILSCIAAIQAPVIMMSQNRQEDRDRKRAEADYKINLKSEIELRQLHQKVDHLLIQQWERMVEIQELQLEVLEELRKNPK
ncbi:MAG TPA: DUF1003 domain-containing protein [Ignavibacteriaceae bacterium]|nr:DUF1003 domain-containing protein [Ignavibacterium sp.]HMN25037.1 DUF1003 domain-containing protein [Ignavibacteriaceae bacterium]HRN26943.1 DUF1003 domain-containing protein [Ignavibacteriaceae bacterium]HRP93013.1 DUF1003 domain-containing protein [Ignavibacteriaceae bacterium]HRQ54632.1 DUF1003 domain-containing protein [Ignavibacteriaceae bacterium]